MTVVVFPPQRIEKTALEKDVLLPHIAGMKRCADRYPTGLFLSPVGSVKS